MLVLFSLLYFLITYRQVWDCWFRWVHCFLKKEHSSKRLFFENKYVILQAEY